MSGIYFFPTHRYAVLDRPQLSRRALAGDPALILIHGGGGTGKSIAAGNVARAFLDKGSREGSVPAAVWVRCQKDDRGREKLWQKIFRTLARAHLSSSCEVAELGGAEVVSITKVIDVLNTFDDPLLILLDDAHLALTADVEESLLDVLEQVPSLTVLLTTRAAPAVLSTQGAAVRVTIRSLNSKDLALTAQEVEDLLRLRTHEVDVGEVRGVAARIHQESRGWPLAVHALTVEYETLVSSPGPGAPAERPRRTFAADFADVLISRANSPALLALYTCAIVSEVSTSLIAQVLAVPLTEARRILDVDLSEDLEVWTDETGCRWYALHDLVAEEISARARTELSEETLRTVARCAALELRSSRPTIAKRMAVLAEDWPLLSTMLLGAEALTLSRAEAQLVRLSEIPEEIRLQFPVIGAFALIQDYAFPDAPIPRIVKGAKILLGRTLVKESLKSGISGLTAAVLRMIVARIYGNDRIADQMVQRAMERLVTLPAPEREQLSTVLPRCVNQIAITLIHTHRFAEVPRALESLLSSHSGRPAQSVVHAHALAAWSAAWVGNMTHAASYIERAEGLTMPVGWKDSYVGAGYRIASALAAMDRGDDAAAQSHLSALAEHSATIEHWPYLLYLDVLIQEDRGGPGEALAVLDEQIRVRRTPLHESHQMLQILRARLMWQSGRVVSGSRSVKKPCHIGVYAALSRGEFDIAAALAAGVYDKVGFSPRARAELLLLRAKCAQRSGDHARAEEFARHAGSIMNANGIYLPMRVLTRTSAEELARLFPDLPVEHSATVRSVRQIRPLSRAETRTLVGVVEHGSIPAAATALHLSANTVKAHMKQVYRKLDVGSREEAIRVAADAGMLAEFSVERDVEHR